MRSSTLFTRGGRGFMYCLILLGILSAFTEATTITTSCSEIHLSQYSTPKDCPNCTYVLREDGQPYCREISICDVALNYSLARPYGCPTAECQLEIQPLTGEEFCTEITLDDHLVNLYWGRSGNFPYGYVFWNCLIVLCVLLALQYLPLLLGVLVTWVVNHLLLQSKTEFFHIRGVVIMILGGRATLTGIEYLSPNVHVKCMELSVNIKWWRGHADIRQAPSSPAAGTGKLPFRMSFFFTGLEISIFNNSPKYELVEGYVLKAIYRTVFSKEPPETPPARDNSEEKEPKQVNRCCQRRRRRGGVKTENAALPEWQTKSTVQPLPKIYNLFPITRVQCRNVVIYMGAPTLPTTSIVHIQRAVGLHFTEPIGADSPNYGLDSYRKVNKFDFRGVIVSSKPNPGFVASDEVEVLRRRMDNKNTMDANGFFNEIIRNLRSGLHDVKVGMKDVRTDWEKTLGQTLASAAGGGVAASAAAGAAPRPHTASEQFSPMHRDDDEYLDMTNENVVDGGAGDNVEDKPLDTEETFRLASPRTLQRNKQRRGLVVDDEFNRNSLSLDSSTNPHLTPISPSSYHHNPAAAVADVASAGDGEDEEASPSSFIESHEAGDQAPVAGGGEHHSKRGWWRWWRSRDSARVDNDEENGTLLRRQTYRQTKLRAGGASSATNTVTSPTHNHNVNSRQCATLDEEPNLLKVSKIELFIHLDQPGRVSPLEMEKYLANHTMLPQPRHSFTFNIGGGDEDEETQIAYGPWADRQRALIFEHFFPFLSEDQRPYVPKLGNLREALAVEVKLNFVRRAEFRFLYREQDVSLLMTDAGSGTRENRGMWAELEKVLKEMLQAQQQCDAAEEKTERARQQKIQRTRASEAQIRRNENQNELPGKLALREIERDAWLLCDGLDIDIFLAQCKCNDDDEDLQLLVETFNAIAVYQHSIVNAVPHLNPSLFPVSEYLTWSAQDRARWLWGEFSGRESCIFPSASRSFAGEENVPTAILELKRCWEALPVPRYLQHLVPVVSDAQQPACDLLAICANEPNAAKRAELQVAASDPRSRLRAWYPFPSSTAKAAAAQTTTNEEHGVHSRQTSNAQTVSSNTPVSPFTWLRSTGNSSNNIVLPPPFESFAGPVSNAHHWNTTCGYLDITVQPGSIVLASIAMYPLISQAGCTTTVTVEFKKPRAVCSVTNATIFEAISSQLTCSIFYPLVWNDTQVWRVNANLYSPVFKFLKQDLRALADLGKDWASNTAEPLSVSFFVPIKYEFAIQTSHCEYKFNVNESNVIDLPEETAEHNTFISVLIPNGTMQMYMDALEYKPATTQIRVDWSWLSDAVLGVPIRCTLLLPQHHPKRAVPMANRASLGGGGGNGAVAGGGGGGGAAQFQATTMPDCMFLEIGRVTSCITYEFHSTVEEALPKVDLLDVTFDFDNWRMTAYPDAMLAMFRFQENYLGAHECFVSRDIFRSFVGENVKTMLAYRMWYDREAAPRLIVENEFEIRVRASFINSLVFLPTELYPRLTNDGALRNTDEDAITVFCRENVIEMHTFTERFVNYSVCMSPIRIQVPNIEKKSSMAAAVSSNKASVRNDHFNAVHETDAFARLFQQTGSSYYGGGGGGSGGSTYASRAYAATGAAEVGQVIVDGLRAEMHTSFGRVSRDALAPLVPYRNNVKCTVGAVWGDLEIHQLSQIKDAIVVFELMLARSRSFDHVNGGTRDPSLCASLPIGHLDMVEEKLQSVTVALMAASAARPFTTADAIDANVPRGDKRFSFADPSALDSARFSEDEEGEGERRAEHIDSTEDFVVNSPLQEEPLTLCFSVELQRVSNLPRALEKRAKLAIQMVCGGQGYMNQVSATLLRSGASASSAVYKDSAAAVTKEGYCFLAGVSGHGADISDLNISLLDTSQGRKRVIGNVKFAAQHIREFVSDFRNMGAMTNNIFDGSYALDAQQCHRSFRQYCAPVATDADRAAYHRQFPPVSFPSSASPPSVVLPTASSLSISKIASMRLCIRFFAVRGTISQIEHCHIASVLPPPRNIERVFETASQTWSRPTFQSKTASSSFLSPHHNATNTALMGEEDDGRNVRDLVLDPRITSAREWRRQFIINAATHLVQAQAMKHVSEVYSHTTFALYTGPVSLCTWANAWDSVLETSLGETRFTFDTLCNERFAWKLSSEFNANMNGKDPVQIDVKHLKRSGEAWSLIGRIHASFDPRMFGTRGEDPNIEVSKQHMFIEAHDAANRIRRVKEASFRANRDKFYLTPAMASLVNLMPRIKRPCNKNRKEEEDVPTPVSVLAATSRKSTLSVGGNSNEEGEDDFMSAFGGSSVDDMFQDCIEVEDVVEDDEDTYSFASAASPPPPLSTNKLASIFVSSRRYASLPFDKPLDCSSLQSLDPFLPTYQVSRSIEPNDYWFGSASATSTAAATAMSSSTSVHQKRELGIAPSARTSIRELASARVPLGFFSVVDADVEAWRKFPVLQRQFTPVVPSSHVGGADSLSLLLGDERSAELDTISIRIHVSDLAEVFVTPACVLFVEDALHLWFPSAPTVTKMTDFFERNYLVLAPQPPPGNRLARRNKRVNVLFSCEKGVSLHFMHSSKWNSPSSSSNNSSSAGTVARDARLSDKLSKSSELVYSCRLSTGTLTVALKSVEELDSKSQSAVIDIGNIGLVLQVASAYDLLNSTTTNNNNNNCFPVVRITVSEALLIQTRQEVHKPGDLTNHLVSSSTASFHGVELVAGVDSIYASYSAALTWGDLVSSILIESAAIWHRQRRQWAVLAGQLFLLAKRIDDTDFTTLHSPMDNGEVPQLASALILWCKTEIPRIGSGALTSSNNAHAEVPLVGFSTLVRTRRIICFLSEYSRTEERMMDVSMDRHFYANPVVSMETFSGAKALFPEWFTTTDAIQQPSTTSADLGHPPPHQHCASGSGRDDSLCRRLVIELLRGVANRVVVKKRSLASSTKSFELRLEGMYIRILDASHKEETLAKRPVAMHKYHNDDDAATELVPSMPMLPADSLCMFVNIRPSHVVFIQHGTRVQVAAAKDRRASDVQLRRRLVPTDIKESIRGACAGIDITAAPELILATRAGATVIAHFQDLVLVREHERKLAFQNLKKDRDALEAQPGAPRKKEMYASSNRHSSNAAEVAAWEPLKTPRRREGNNNNDGFFPPSSSSPDVVATAAPHRFPQESQSFHALGSKPSSNEDIRNRSALKFQSERATHDTLSSSSSFQPRRRGSRGSFAAIGDKIFGRSGTKESDDAPLNTSSTLSDSAPPSKLPSATGSSFYDYSFTSPRVAAITAAPVPPRERIVMRNISVTLNMHSCAFRFTSTSLKEREGKIIEDKSALVTLSLQSFKVSWTQVLSNARPPAAGDFQSDTSKSFRDFGLFLIHGLKLRVEGDGKISRRGVAWCIENEMQEILLNVVRGNTTTRGSGLETRIFADSSQSKCNIPLHAIDNENLNEYVDRWVNAFRIASEHAEMMRLGNLLEWERRGSQTDEETVEDSLSRSLLALGLPTLASEFSNEDSGNVGGGEDLAWMNPFANDFVMDASPTPPSLSPSASPEKTTSTTTANQRRSASRGAAAQQQFDYVKENASALLRVVFTLRMHNLSLDIHPSQFAKFTLGVDHVTFALDRRTNGSTSALAYFSPSALQFAKRDQRSNVDFSQSLPSSWVIAKSTTRHRTRQKRPTPSLPAPPLQRGETVTKTQVTVLMEAIRHRFTPAIFHQFLSLQSGLSSEVGVLLESVNKFRRASTGGGGGGGSRTNQNLVESEYLLYLQGVSLQALASSRAVNPNSQIWTELETKEVKIKMHQAAHQAAHQASTPNYSLSVRDLKLSLLSSATRDNADVVHLIRALCNIELSNSENEDGSSLSSSSSDVICLAMDQNSIVIRPMSWTKLNKWLDQYSQAYTEDLEHQVDKYAKHVWNTVKHTAHGNNNNAPTKQTQSLRFLLTNSSLLVPFVDDRKKLSALVCTVHRIEALGKSEQVYEASSQDGHNNNKQRVHFAFGGIGKKPRRYSSTMLPSSSFPAAAPPPPTTEFRKGLFVLRKKYVARVECVNVEASFVNKNAENLLPVRWISSVVHRDKVHVRRRCSVELPLQTMSIVGEEIEGKTDWNIVLTVTSPNVKCDRSLSQCIAGMHSTWTAMPTSLKERRLHEAILRDPTDVSTFDITSTLHQASPSPLRATANEEQKQPVKFLPRGSSSLQAFLVVHRVDFNLKLESGKCQLFGEDVQALQRRSSMMIVAKAAAAAASKSPSNAAAAATSPEASVKPAVARGPRQAMIEAQRAAVRAKTDDLECTAAAPKTLLRPSPNASTVYPTNSSFSKSTSAAATGSEETFWVDLPAITFASIYTTDLESHELHGHLVVATNPFSLSPKLFAFFEDIAMGAEALVATTTPARPAAATTSQPPSTSKTKIVLTARLCPVELNFKQTQDQITSSLKLRLDNGADFAWTYGAASEQLRHKPASYISINIPTTSLVLHEAHPALELTVSNVNIAFHQVEQVVEQEPMFTAVVSIELVRSHFSLWRIESFFALQREWDEAWEEISAERKARKELHAHHHHSRSSKPQNSAMSRYSSNLKLFDQMVMDRSSELSTSSLQQQPASTLHRHNPRSFFADHLASDSTVSDSALPPHSVTSPTAAAVMWPRSRILFLSLRVSSVVSESQLGVLASTMVVKINEVSVRLALPGQVPSSKRNPDPDQFHFMAGEVEIESTGAYEGILECKRGFAFFYAREKPVQYNALLHGNSNGANTLNRMMLHCPATSFSFSRVFNAVDSESVGNRTILMHVALTAFDVDCKDDIVDGKLQRNSTFMVDSSLVHLSVSAAPILFDAVDRLAEEIRLARRGHERTVSLRADSIASEAPATVQQSPPCNNPFFGTVIARVHHADLSLVHDASSTVWGTTVMHLGARLASKPLGSEQGDTQRIMTLVFSEVDIFRYPGKGPLIVSSIMGRKPQSQPTMASPAVSTATSESDEDLFPSTATTPMRHASAGAGVVSQEDAARRATEARRERIAQAATATAAAAAHQTKKQNKRNIVYVPKSTITMTTVEQAAANEVTYKFVSDFSDVISVSTDQREYSKLREILGQMRFSNRASQQQQQQSAVDLRQFVQSTDADSFVFYPQLNIMGEATQKVMDWFFEQNMRVKRTDLPKQFHLLFADSFERLGGRCMLASSSVNAVLRQVSGQQQDE